MRLNVLVPLWAGWSVTTSQAQPVEDATSRLGVSPILPPPAGCTYTTYTEPIIAAGPTSTIYTLTTYTSKLFDCHGCSNLAVIVLGHIFAPINLTTTVIATNITTATLPQCSSTSPPSKSTRV